MSPLLTIKKSSQSALEYARAQVNMASSPSKGNYEQDMYVCERSLGYR